MNFGTREKKKTKEKIFPQLTTYLYQIESKNIHNKTDRGTPKGIFLLISSLRVLGIKLFLYLALFIYFFLMENHVENINHRHFSIDYNNHFSPSYMNDSPSYSILLNSWNIIMDDSIKSILISALHSIKYDLYYDHTECLSVLWAHIHFRNYSILQLY